MEAHKIRVGRIVRIIGPVVDVAFEGGELPDLLTELVVHIGAG